jgi:hypothetical protein
MELETFIKTIGWLVVFGIAIIAIFSLKGAGVLG